MTTDTKQPKQPDLVPNYGTYTDRTYGGRMEAKAVFGARLIAPSDLLHDRQDLVFKTEDDKKALIAWLNGPGYGNGAISKAQKWLRDNAFRMGEDSNSHVLYEDDEGIMVGSRQASYGYVYITGWLKK